MFKNKEQNIQIKFIILAILAIVITLLFLLENEFLNLHQILLWQAQMKNWFEESPLLFSFIYFMVFTCITAFCLPGASLLMLTCAGCMNFTLCCLLSTGASALGALITMMAARYALRRQVEYRYEEQLKLINKGLEKNKISYLLSLRLAPVIPFVLFNLVAGLTRIRASTFLWTSFVGMLPGTALYVQAGSQAGQARSLDDLLSIEMLASIAALAVVPWLFNWIFSPINRSERT